MAPRKKTRSYSRYKLDEDYLSKLSTADRAWLEKFNDEYYRGDFGADPLHPRGEARREIYRRHNEARRDVLTRRAADILESAARVVAPRPSLLPRYYSPADYAADPGPAREDALIEWIDSQGSLQTDQDQVGENTKKVAA